MFLIIGSLLQQFSLFCNRNRQKSCSSKLNKCFYSNQMCVNNGITFLGTQKDVRENKTKRKLILFLRVFLKYTSKSSFSS